MRVPLGRSGWYFCDWNDPPPDETEYREFQGSETYAQQWLGQFRQDSFAMSGLHHLWARTSAEKLTDDEVVRLVAWWLRSGKVKARQHIPEITSGGSVVSIEKAAPPRRSGPDPSSQSEDPSTLPGDADQEAIAGVLRAAAEDGTPFCEECARAAAAAGRA